MDYPTPIVSVEWLHNHLDDRTVRVVDCRFALMDPMLGVRQYQSGHIPGAIHVDLNQHLSSPVQKHGGRHPLPNIDTLASTLGEMGIQSTSGCPDESGLPASSPPASFVVIYDDSRFAFASRLWWLLRYMGHDQVAILDGGFLGWQSAGYPVTQETDLTQSATFIPDVQADWVVDIHAVKQTKDLPGTILVDSRQGDRYRGEREPIDPVAGHIPGAVNLFWQDITTDTGHIRPPDWQQARWQQVLKSRSGPLKNPASAANPPQDVIIYCGSGVTACVNLLSLELAGLPPGKLYAGSWSDWCSYL